MSTAYSVKTGDKVQWTHVSTRRGVLSMALRSGVVAEIKGDWAWVQVRGRRRQVEVRRLRPIDTPSQIGEFVEAIREAHRGAEGGEQ